MPRPRAELLAFALVALLALPVLAPTARAQVGSDLQVTLVSVTNPSLDPRFLVPTNLTVTIENKGDGVFEATSGWQVFVGWNGVGDRHCIDGDEDRANANRECYHRVNPALDRDLAPGDTYQFTIPWTPHGDAQRGTGAVYVHIGRFGTVQSDSFATSPPPGPDDVSQNNVRSFPMTVRTVAVAAEPDRDAPPGSQDPNQWWTWEQIRDQAEPDCLGGEQANRKGCRATPGTLTRWAYTVRNLGTLADSFTATVQYDPEVEDQEENLTAQGWRFVVTPSVVSLAPGASQTVHLDVLMPAGLEHNKGLNLNGTSDPSPKLALRWHSSVNPQVHTASQEHCAQAACRDPWMPSLYAGVRRGLAVTAGEPVKPVQAGGTVAFDLRVENLGNAPDNHTVTLVPERSQVGDAWKPRIGTSQPILPGGSGAVRIEVTAPFDAPKGPYRFEVRVQSQGDATGELARNVTLTADLQQRFAVSSHLLPTYSEVAPGQKATYVLTVTNVGNGPDNATLEVSGAPAGWETQLSRNVVPLAPFGRQTVQLNVTAPPGAAAGTRSSITLQVASQGSNNPSGFPRERAADVVAETVVLSRPHPALRLEGPAKRFVDPGSSTEYALHVRNVGNLASNFSIRLEPSDPSWGASATPAFLVLNPLEQGTTTIRLRAPADAPVGEILNIVATVRAAADQSQLEQTTLIGMVSGPDLAVKGVAANATAPYSGDPLAVDVTVANEGNRAPPANATLRVLFLQAGVERVVGERRLEPADLPGGRRFTERFLWDTAAVEGPGVLVARIDPEDALREIDDSAASNEASLALTLRTFDLSIAPPEPLSGRPGEKVSYAERPHVFLLRHRGNAAVETVRVLVESENGWIDPAKAEQRLDLPKGVEVPLPLDVLVPFRPGVPSDLLRVTVIPELRAGSSRVASVATRVVDDEKPVIAGVSATPRPAKVGENVTLEALVRDATGVASVTLVVVAPDNSTTPHAMAHVGGDRWALTQTFATAGLHRLFVEAVDRSEPANSNTSRNALVELPVDPGEAPVIRLADGQATILRSGTPVRLNVTDALGVARAQYVIRGIVYGMERPYQVDTSAFPPGPIEVLVEAENVRGAKSSARFNLTIDDTPPAPPSVTRSGEGETVTITIETDPDAAAVEVRVRRDGQVIETRAATKKAPGVWELVLRPAQGEHVLDVTVRDEAGNARLVEGAVTFGARAPGPLGVPGPAPPLALLVLAALALLARRKRT